MIPYEDAGVSIDNGNTLVEAVKSLVKEASGQNVIGGVDSFVGAFRLPGGHEKPVILGTTDGVNTKLRLAIDAKCCDTIGQDLVTMRVNNLICNFATPLFFPDYYVTVKLEVGVAKAVVEGIAKGCKEASCALVGGETAEIPGMYTKNDFDLAGFAVGIAEEEDPERDPCVKNGDLPLTLPSSGLHSDGYSLAKGMLFESLKMKFDGKIEGRNLIDVLLEPTRICVKDFSALKSHINALAHITGGSLVENLPCVLPRGVRAVIKKHHLKTPGVFYHIGKMVEGAEMYRSFNTGVGLVLVVSPNDTSKMLESTDTFIIGGVVINKGVILK